MCGRGEGRGVERRAEGRGVSEEEGEGKAEKGSNSCKSSHCPSFVVRSVLLWKVYLPGKKKKLSIPDHCVTGGPWRRALVHI